MINHARLITNVIVHVQLVTQHVHIFGIIIFLTYIYLALLNFLNMGPSMIGIPPLKHQGLTPKILKFTFFFTFPMTCLNLLLFFLMSNEIILFQILSTNLEYQYC